MTLYSYIEDILMGLSYELYDINFTAAFPPDKKPIPLKKVTVAAECTNARFYGGSLGDISEYGRSKKAEILIKFFIYSPYSMGGEECFKTFYRICDELIFRNPVPLKEISCGDISVSPKADAFLLTAYARFEGELGEGC